MPIYFAWFTTALLSVGGDADDQNLPQSGRLLYCVRSGFLDTYPAPTEFRFLQSVIRCEHSAMFLRFVISEIDEDSQRELGIFQAIHKLRRRGVLSQYEEQQDDSIGKWFDKNLDKPTRFSASKPPFYRKKSKAISWFKDSAHDHIARVRTLVAILQNHGISVRMLTTDRVGYVVYEDEHQIVAEPFAGEKY
jgi:hypothetical protein